MISPVLLTKVTIPYRRVELLARQRLIDLFDDLLDNKLIIVTAPAGYGKTSLLIDVARLHEFPFCWYSQGSTDSELQTFLTHFVASIEQKFPYFGEQSKAALQAMGQADLSVESFETTIANEIYRTIREHFVIVLDDYHLVMENEQVNQFVSRFVQDVDQNCHLVIISRSLLPLPDLPLLVARSLVGGIGLRELAFRPEEIKALMLQNYSQAIPDSVAAELAQKTEGWITGLLLSAQTLWEGMVDRLRLLQATGVGLYDYLIQEVLDEQPDELRDFLLRTSYLEEFNAELCEALLGAPPAGYTWQAMLREVIRHNLFVLPLEREGLWLRYHHLFGDFLQNRLAQEQPELLDQLLRQIVKIRLSREEWELAYAACLRLGDIDATADLLERAGEPMVRSGRMALLEKWLEAMPAHVIDQRPKLLSRQGCSIAILGDTERGLRLLDRAVTEFIASENRTRLAGTLVWRAYIHYLQADCTRSLADVLEVLSLTEEWEGDEELTRFRAEAYRILGQNDRLLGRLGEAVDHFSQALVLYQSQSDVTGVISILSGLGAAHLEAGEFGEAYACYERSRDYYRARNDAYGLAEVLNDLAYLHHLRGEFPKASATFEEALVKANESGDTRGKALILIGLGDLFLDLGAFESASLAYSQAREAIERVKDRFLIAYLDLAEAGAARLKGDLPRAANWLEAAGHLVSLIQSDYARGLYLLEEGQLSFEEKNFNEAIECLSDAGDLFIAGGQQVFAGRTELMLANVYFEMGQTASAVAHLERSFRLVAKIDSFYVLVSFARRAKLLLSSPLLPGSLRRQAQGLLEQVERFESAQPRLRRSLRFQKMTIPISQPRLRIQALGAALVLVDGRLLTNADWQTLVTRDLLFLLLSRPQGSSKEGLGEVFWPGSTPAQLKNRFKNAIYRLRRALQQDVIIFDGSQYKINRDLDYEYDVERFLELLAQAESTRDVEKRSQAYQELVRVYQGDYLPELDGDWVIPERERIRQAFLLAGLQLAGLYLEASQFDRALELCQRLMVEDPCLEKAYFFAMQANLAKGHKTAAIHLYERLEQALSSGPGITPSAELEALFRSILR